MALLSRTTYNRLAKNADKAALVLANTNGETAVASTLVNLVQHKAKISTRWETTESNNIHPFTYAALTINGKVVVVSNIKPIESTLFGFVDIDYEWND